MAAEISRWLCCELTQESVAEIHGVASSPLPFGKPLYAHGSARWIYRARVHKNLRRFPGGSARVGAAQWPCRWELFEGMQHLWAVICRRFRYQNNVLHTDCWPRRLARTPRRSREALAHRLFRQNFGLLLGGGEGIPAQRADGV